MYRIRPVPVALVKFWMRLLLLAVSSRELLSGWSFSASSPPPVTQLAYDP